MRDGRLVIMRDRSQIWQSAARYAVRDAAHMADILPGQPGIAFEVHPSGPWFIARGRGPEHRVAAAGWPEMWTRSGNLIVVLHRPRSRSFGYAVYAPSGSRLATLATGLTVSVAGQRDDDLGAGTFWYLTAGRNLARTDGTATRIIASTRALGLTSSAPPSVSRQAEEFAYSLGVSRSSPALFFRLSSAAPDQRPRSRHSSSSLSSEAGPSRSSPRPPHWTSSMYPPSKL